MTDQDQFAAPRCRRGCPDRVPFGVTDIFKIGIGPSSSHTVGPMRAAAGFRASLISRDAKVARVRATAHASLAWTGKGHATDKALVLGLAGADPETIDPDEADAQLDGIAAKRAIVLDGQTIAFDAATDVVFDCGEQVGRHPNALTFEAWDAAGSLVKHEVWYSVGGGFVERDGDTTSVDFASERVPFPYATGKELLAASSASGLSLARLGLANETSRKPQIDVFAFLDTIIAIMDACIERGLSRRGILPGGLQVRRRAAEIFDKLEARRRSNHRPPHEAMDYVSVFAMAVNEENACGGRVVTAPTNGASGVIPAVLRYHRVFCDGSPEDARTLLLTAAVVGDLVKRNASISGAEIGCQGEVGSAAAMAAAGLCAVLGGSSPQVLDAAEIGLEHHLGMTCDPVGGLVQIPCIERNAFGAVKAINAASLALNGNGDQRVTLDQVIETMRQTGRDMKSEYRETSRGGLAANVPAC